jgi:putative heme-binding domain-containing protein
MNARIVKPTGEKATVQDGSLAGFVLDSSKKSCIFLPLMKCKSLLRWFPLALVGTSQAVPPEFEIRRYAGYPEVNYPTAVSAAANGDVYVSSDPNGSLGHVKGYGKVIRCRDTDGDGKADEFKDFVPTLHSARGGHFLRDTLYIIHPPYLSSFTDKDGDGVAEEHKELVKGFGWGIEHPRGADHTTNGLRMGIDGWLYVAVGDFGMPEAKGTDGAVYTLFGGGVVRVRPDGSEMEPYALYCRNICDVAISPTLDMFARDNTNDGKGWNTRLHHFVQYANHGYPKFYHNFKDEMLAPLADYGGGSGTGGLYLHEPNFPAGYGDTLYTCDWTTGKFHRHPLKPFEASFVTDQDDFHVQSRAIDMDVDGSQRIYLADWRDGGFKYSGDGKAVGLVQQVTLKGAKHTPFPDLKKLDAAALVKGIVSPSAVARLETQREILARNDKTAFQAPLLAYLKDEKLSLAARVAAIFTYKQLLGAEANPALSSATADASIREFALRAMTDRKTQLANVPVKPYHDGLKDPNPRVKRAAMTGLARIGKAENAPALLAAATTLENDPATLKKGAKFDQSEAYILPHIAVQCLIEMKAIKPCLAALEVPAQRRYALMALQQLHCDETVDGLLNIAKTTSDNELRIGVLGALARLMHKEKPWDLNHWWQTRPDDRGPYYMPITWEASDRITASIEENFPKVDEAGRKRLIELFAKNRLDVAKLKLGNLDPVTLALGMPNVDASTAAILLNATKDNNRAWSERIDCYNALLRCQNDATKNRIDVLAHWLDDSKRDAAADQLINDFVNETARGTEINLLNDIGKKGNDSVSRIAWRALLTITQSPLAKSQWKEQVQKITDKNPMEVGFFLALADMKLSGYGKQIDAAINFDNKKTIDAAKAAKESIASAQGQKGGQRVMELKPEEVTKIAMTTKGDIANGQKLYTAQGCIACHSVDPAAEQKGPYLGAAGAKFTRDYLIESVIEPGKVVAQGFQTSHFIMKDGSMKMGFVTSEQDGLVSLRDIAGSASQIKRADVKEEQHPGTSMMPAGLAAGLTTQEFTDLIEYLVSLKKQGG